MALNVDDLVDVQREIFEVCTKWYDIGLQLKIPVYELERIDKIHTDPRVKLREVLIFWLKSIEPDAHWRTLVTALRDRTVAEDRLANELERKYVCDIPRPQTPEIRNPPGLGTFSIGVATLLLTSSLFYA